MRGKSHNHSPHTPRSLTLDGTLARVRRIVVSRAQTNARARAPTTWQSGAAAGAAGAAANGAGPGAGAAYAGAAARAEWLSENAFSPLRICSENALNMI